ncbi:type IV toxin-antitoxin system AbiEi family antitoxin domain-containing protein [Paenarthrobacter aromaticivorans]|uniref:Type IV toxin-antitoxin system AbiEi family antitoxin domain-containing protein n=1 Tax=Paenarthrobacter aromaticivorans TaxID=2849150 RepID=A0ABS6IFC4_9MICC|nr:type IV toxin-antitoxin system AbiEi family antitoxin domain-containing protein [Paenarthrobacter sp. MMS21-TAE1-1]MBU8869074.1 type IV toxin-antitoxin system AbiEi family antitoxin domain-containing protein [Paenarthrobacter sp. MMS21-TAE1-1]
MNLIEFLQSRHGAARTTDLKRAGFTERSLSEATRSGAIERVQRGVYVTKGADPDVVAAFRANGRLTCISAARFYGFWTLHDPDILHLTCGNGLPNPAVVNHALALHPRHPYLPVVGVADVVMHALRCLPELESLVMVQSAIALALLTPDYLRSRLTGNRNGKARSILDLVLPRADSLLEVLAHTHFVRAGLRVRMHVQLPGVGEVDCLIDDCLVIELDGGTHLEGKQVKKDQYRNNASIRGGHLVLRYYYADVVHNPERMVSEVLAVLANREAGRFGPSRLQSK